jgi:hypothetical protein
MRCLVVEPIVVNTVSKSTGLSENESLKEASLFISSFLQEAKRIKTNKRQNILKKAWVLIINTDL